MFEAQVLWWYWALFGLGLVVVELLLPDAFMLWLGIAAILVSGILALFPEMPLSIQLIIFSILALGTTYAGKKLMLKLTSKESGLVLNKRGQSYIGHTFPLEEPIVQGVGFLNIDDTRWKIHGEDAPVGTIVKVISVQDNILLVKNTK